MSYRSQNTENYGSDINFYIAIYHSNKCTAFKPKLPKYLEKVTKFTNPTFEVVQKNFTWAHVFCLDW